MVSIVNQKIIKNLTNMSCGMPHGICLFILTTNILLHCTIYYLLNKNKLEYMYIDLNFLKTTPARI